MNFWWVNHKQTSKEEIRGGYLWSPMQNKDGSRNQTYLNMKDAAPQDVVFSYAGGKISAIGIVERRFATSEKPADFGKVGDQWSKEGWIVSVRWTDLKNPIVPQQHLSEIVPLLPPKYSPIRENGYGNQKFYLMRIDAKLGHLLMGIAKAGDLEVVDLVEQDSQEIDDEGEEARIRKQALSPIEKTQLIKARRGQGVFRSNLERIEKRCRLTGVDDRRVLVASHIKPWRAGTNEEKLDGNNGLLLSPHVDRLFDRGWISFADDGRIICPHANVLNIMAVWSLKIDGNVGVFNPKQRRYLEYHRSTELRQQ